jgi:HAMP domain-containing protein
MHDLMNDEINRLAQQDARFAQAIIDFYEANRRYEDARKGKDD